MKMNKKKTVKFLTVIWGERYIEEFAKVSLPSYLAPGNLPYMAEKTDLGILIMTSKDSVSKLKANDVFKQLEDLCPVEFILIDDLITNGMYGVVLTLAYARGIRSCGEDQVNTHFVFMNSDFVLADGSLQTLTGEIEKGKACVMASSLRASAEAVMPALLDAVDTQNNILSMQPRHMVRLALENLHPTVIAKTVNQGFVNSSTYNQIYWAIDRETLLGRCHLIFMLMIKPERPLPPVNSYCDYGLVPELVPSAALSAIEDSDRFFMLEAQPAKQELDFLRCGVRSPDKIATELEVWSTAEHRACANFNFVFHAGDVPASLGKVTDEAESYIQDIRRRMGDRPKDHAFHFYWVGGVEAWNYLRREGDVHNREAVDVAIDPPEFHPSPEYAAYEATGAAEKYSLERRAGAGDQAWSQPNRGWTVQLLRTLRRVRSRRFFYALIARLRNKWLSFGRWLKGEFPDVASWTSSWSDAKVLRDWVAKIDVAEYADTLIIGEPHDPTPKFFDGSKLVDLRREKDFLKSSKEPQKQYAHILMRVNRQDIRRTRQLVQHAISVAGPNAQIAISIAHPNYETDSSNFSYELAQYVNEVLPNAWLDFDISAIFTGGKFKRTLRIWEGRLSSRSVPTSLREVPVGIASVLLLPFVAALTFLNNTRLRKPSQHCPDFCSSALLVLQVRGAK